MHCPKMLKNTSKVVITIAFFISVFAGSMTIHQVWAQIDDQSTNAEPQSQSTLTAIPPRLGDDDSITVKPGEVKQTTVRVKNSSSQPLNIMTQVNDFVLDQDGETPIALTDTEVSNRWSLASWITIAPNLQTIAPNETKVISVVINVPEDALPGGHYAMITHQPTTTKPDEAELTDTSVSASGISQKVGTLLYVKVEGQINENAFIRNLSFPQLTEYGPVPYSFTVENQSDIHIRPALMLEIRDIFGRKVDQFPIETKNIFPLTERRFDSKWEKVWGTGRYTAILTMNYGTQGAVAIAKASFWLFPVTLVVTFLIVVLVVLAMGIAVRRHLIHRKTDQSAKIKELEEKLEKLENN